MFHNQSGTPPSHDRRDAILAAAQRLFLDQGYAATSIADLRAASGASTGSIYHAFKSKEGIALALFSRAVRRWADATRAAQRGDTIELRIRASVEGLLHWAADDPDGFRVMDLLRSVGEAGAAGAELTALLEEGKSNARVLLLAAMEAGTVRRMPWQAAQAIVLGPAYEFLRISRRHKLAAEERRELVDLFATAAWATLSGEGATQR
jgi:AcrR family transcriptional regulator